LKALTRKARQAFDFERKVDLQELFVVLALGVVHDVVHHGVHLLVVQRLHIDAPHIAVDPDHRRQAGRQVQVGCLVLDAEGQQLGNVHGIPLWFVTLHCNYDHDCRQSPSRAARMAAACAAARPDACQSAGGVQDLWSPTRWQALRGGQRAVWRELHSGGGGEDHALRRLPIEWHCIGPIQSNKTRLVAEHFDWVHTVDRLKIAQRLSEQRPDMAPLCRLHPGQHRWRPDQGRRGAAEALELARGRCRNCRG
jgi:hypothetical protein